MAVEDDPAWPRYKKALDDLERAKARDDALPEGHPDKPAAKAAVKLAEGAVRAAAAEIEPKTTGL